ncbi:PqqD family protein [Chamaesiphon polymorphus]|uniref:Pyrroloquinoline quinone biosynthesis protein PqqD n=1 Tax=Chamaesiphon polymorphus CCALA 037 TaxID=2107692 RepID=A0A2T1GIV0_9CYAN|nr:PqqD family protein [Chamaesiphon polymorphus]PSB57686.1 pyrroloquinoline quinone biosynthesis protein PqqD [Chamaesiphon polymorphus CCALA 037]
MENGTVFRVNSPQVVSETIDGEVVIVNLDKGIYYSLLKTGADVWSRIERQLDRQELVREVVRSYDGSVEEIEIAIDEFIANLLAEELIVIDPQPRAASTENSPEILETSGSKPHFEKPLVEKFTDMEDLLLLDPIHEVDVDAGWPTAKAA